MNDLEFESRLTPLIFLLASTWKDITCAYVLFTHYICANKYYTIYIFFTNMFLTNINILSISSIESGSIEYDS